MKERTVSNLAQLEELFRKNFDRSHNIFRGVTDAHHKLRPKVGREVDGHQPYKLSREQGLLERFKQFAALHVSRLPTNDWDWLALAQHHGLATRLLDWSFNPMVATWFALDQRYAVVKPKNRGHSDQNPPKVPAAVYVRKMPSWVNVRTAPDPFDVNQIVSFLPTHVSPRITTQSGLFTVHPDPSRDWNDDAIKIILLDFAEGPWREATRILLRVGFHRYGLFPDLDGLATNLNMLYVRGLNLAYGTPADLGEQEEDEEG